MSFSIYRALKWSKNLNFEEKNHIFGLKVFKNQKISHFILYKAYFYCISTPAIMILLSLLKKFYLVMLLDEFWPKSQIFDKYGFLMGKSFHLNMDKFAKISHDVVFFSPKMIRFVLSEHPWRKKHDLSQSETLWTKILVYLAILRHCASTALILPFLPKSTIGYFFAQRNPNLTETFVLYPKHLRTWEFL